jgi:predicted transcriptional regulator
MRSFPVQEDAGMTTKERAWEVIQRLPDEVSMDRVIYELQLLRSIERGVEEADRGEGIPHAEVTKMFSADGARNASD